MTVAVRFATTTRLLLGAALIALGIGSADCNSGGNGSNGNGLSSGRGDASAGGSIGGQLDATTASDDGGTTTAEAGDTTPPVFGGLESATAIDESHVGLAWSPATDDVTPQGTLVYRVYVGLTAGGEVFSRPFVTTPAGATGALLQGLRAATPYYFVVHAVDAAGNEDTNSVERSATTTDTTPPVFAGLQTAIGTDRDKLLLTWNAASDNGSPASAIRYFIFYSAIQGGENYNAPDAMTPAGATQYTLTGLAEAATYFIVVRAVDAAGNIDGNVDEKSGTTLDKTPPTFGGATSASAVGTSITVRWVAATDSFLAPSSLFYVVYTATSSGAEDFSSPSFVTTAGATSYTSTHLPVSTKYYYVVRSKDSFGNVDTNTREVSATTAASSDVTPPVFAGLATAAGTSDTTIDLSWLAAHDDFTAAGNIVYDVYMAQAAGGEEYSAGPTFTTDPGATSFTVTGLQPLETEYFVVRARDEAGNEDANTAEQSTATLADTVPPSFAGLTSATPTGPATINLAWAPATDDVSSAANITYRVYMGSAPGAESATPAATTVPGATSIDITGLTPNTSYTFYVRAVDAANNADTTTPPVEVTAKTPHDTTAPAFAGVTTLVSTDPKTLTAGWAPAQDNVTPASGIVYLAYISATKGAELSTTPIVTASGATSVSFAGLTPQTTYYVIVRAEDMASNIDGNTAELSAATQADVTPPTFAGAASAGSASDTSLTVTWSAANDFVTPPSGIKYLVCVTQTNGGCSGSLFTTTTTVTGVTSVPIDDLSPNTTYYFVVRSVDAAGNDDGNSTQISGLTAKDQSPPQFMSGTGLSATAMADASILLTWNAANDDVSSPSQIVYDIFQAAASGAELYNSPTYTTAAGATTYLIPQQYPPLLQPSTAYFFVVRARDMAGNEDTNATEATATTKADRTAPVFNGASNISTPSSLTQLTVNWVAASDDITAPVNIVYLVCWATDTSCATAFSPMAATAGGATSATITPLLAGTTYNVVVRARDVAGNIDANTTVVSAATLADTAAPTAVGGSPYGGATGCSAATATSLTVNWNLAVDNYSPQASLRYLVCETTLSNGCGGLGSPFTVTATVTNGTSYTFSSLTPTTTYYFVVRAEDQANNVDTNYNVVSGQTVVDTTPPTFAGLTGCVDATGANSDGNITLSWSAASDNVSTPAQIAYDIYWSTTSGGETTSGAANYSTSAGVTSVTVPLTTPALLPSKTYFFIVRARDAAGNRSGPPTSPYVEMSATTSTDAIPPVFAGITGLTQASDSQLTATWAAATDDTSPASSITYWICWNVHGTTPACSTTFTRMDTTGAGATTYTSTQRALLPAKSYDFVVHAVDASGNADTNTQSKTASTAADVTAPTAAGGGPYGGATSVSGNTLTSLTVNWSTASDDATPAANIVYDVCKTTSPLGCSNSSFSTTNGVSGATGTSYTFNGLLDSQTYYFVVRARDATGNEDTNSNQVSGMTSADATPPTWVTTTGLQSATVVSDSSIQLSWNLAQDNYSTQTNITFDIYEANAAGGEVYTGTPVLPLVNITNLTQVSGAAPNTYTVTGLTPGTPYCFVVRAFDQANNHDSNTTEICKTTQNYPVPSFAVSGQPVATPSFTTIGLTWLATVAPSETINYTVCYSTSSGACPSGGTQVPVGTATSYTISGLSPAKTATPYYVMIIASDLTKAGGTVQSSDSNQVTTNLTADTTPPGTPGAFTLVPSTFPFSMGFTWTAPTDNATSTPNLGYKLCANGCAISYTIPAGGGSTTTGAWLGVQGGSTQGSALVSNTAYTFALYAIDQAGNLSTAATGSATTDVSFANDVYNAIMEGTGPDTVVNSADACTFCHSSAGQGDVGPTPGFVGTTAAATWTFITTQTTPTPVNGSSDPYGAYTECNAGKNFIVANQTANSLIFEKVSGANVCSGNDPQMPLGGAPMAASLINQIGFWINQGATNN